MVPYDLRHSFASLLIHEKRLSIVEIADQLGHAPRMTSDTYGHVMRELRGAEPVSAEEQIRRARARVSASARRAEPWRTPDPSCLPSDMAFWSLTAPRKERSFT